MKQPTDEDGTDPHSDFNMAAPSETSPSEGRLKSIVHRFPLKGTGFPPHPADVHGALANWADVYGVMVGPRKQPFAIHRHIVEKIPLLRDRLLTSTDSIESRTGSMTLDEVDTMSFAVAVDFAYVGHLEEKRIRLHYARPDVDSDDEDEEQEEDDHNAEFHPDAIPTIEPPHTPQDPAEAKAEAEFLLFVDPSLRSPKVETKSVPPFLNPSSSPTGQNPEVEIQDEDEDADEDAILPSYDNLLVSLFDLAQALQYEAFANAVIDSYARILAEDPPSAWALKYLQRKGLENSKMMEMMLRGIAWCIHAEGYDAWSDADFMQGWVTTNVKNGGLVMAAMAGWNDEKNPFQNGPDGVVDLCEWHTHVMTEKCKRKRKLGGGGGEKNGKSSSSSGPAAKKQKVQKKV